jgi:hypothetical protein
MMDALKITLTAKAHDGKLAVNTEIPVPLGDGEYQVTINVIPNKNGLASPLGRLYGILADDPMPEIDDDLPFEQRDEFEP